MISFLVIRGALEDWLKLTEYTVSFIYTLSTSRVSREINRKFYQKIRIVDGSIKLRAVGDGVKPFYHLLVNRVGMCFEMQKC